MHLEEFKAKVRFLATPDDYNENNYLLDFVPKEMQYDFTNCLIIGMDIQHAKAALGPINRISKAAKLDSEQIIMLLPEFNILVGLANIKPL